MAILDLMLPKVHGLEILRRIREQGFTYPVLILTVQGSVPDRVQGLDLGADDHLVKPFAFEELLAQVRALVRRRYQERSPVIEIRKLRIDTVGQQVFFKEREIDLTGREYALLELLARRAGGVVTRTEIWEHLYAYDSERISNVVDVFIASLQVNALDRPSLRPIRHLGTDWSRYSKYATCMEAQLDTPGSMGRFWPSGRVGEY